MTVEGERIAAEIERDIGHRLEARIGDRIVYAPVERGSHTDEVVWARRMSQPSLVIDVAGGWVHSIELHSGSYGVWSGRKESVRVIGRAVYTDDALTRAIEHVATRAEIHARRAEAEHLREQVVESEYRRELAEAVAREMTEQYPPKLFLPGDAEPARAEPIGESRIVLRNAVFALGTGYVYRQMHEDEWYAAHLASSVFSWEQVLGEGPCIAVDHPDGVGRLFDVLTTHRQRERDVQSVMWTFERDIDHAARSVGCDPDRHPAGSIEEFRAIIARAHLTISRLYSRVESAKQ